MNIRFAIPADAPQLLPLFEQVGYPTTVERLTRKIDIYSDHAHCGLLVADLDRKIVGFIALVFSESIVKEAAHWGRIELLVVDVSHRRQGIGRALVARAEELAIQLGCHGIDLVSLVRRAPEGTHDFYRSLGYGNEGENAMVYFAKRF